MDSRRVQIVTFNSNEARAVDAFLAQLVGVKNPTWKMDSPLSAVAPSTPKQTIQHVPLAAQGNTIAAGQVARFFADSEAQDFIIFYGCAGAVDPGDVGSAFLVSGTNYVSLGTVEMTSHQENVTVKSKWIVDTPSNDGPLSALDLPLVSDSRLDLPMRTRIPTAHVIATDKVVRVGPAAPPIPLNSLPPHNTYTAREWSYAESLGYFKTIQNGVLLVEMESFGICTIAHALGIAHRTLILRVATDDLVHHKLSDEQQFALLLKGRIVLARLVLAVLRPGVRLS